MKRFVLLPSLLLLSGCSVFQSHHQATGPVEPGLSIVEAPRGHGQLNYALASGEYKCEHGARLAMHRHATNRELINIQWSGRSYELQRDPSSSGLPRYEDQSNGLVWIELPWKGVLLDGKTNKPLANECATT